MNMQKKAVVLVAMIAVAAVLIYAAHSLDVFEVLRKMHGG